MGKKVKTKIKKTKGELAPVEYISPLSRMREFDRMFDEFRRGFEDMFWGPFSFDFERPFIELGMPMLEMTREPLVDLVDMGDRFELNAEIPGIPKDKIDIRLSDDSIEIKAEMEEEKEEEEKEYCCKERSYSGFYRKMTLPDEIIADKAEAKKTNGMLKITLPKKKPKRKPKRRKLKIE